MNKWWWIFQTVARENMILRWYNTSLTNDVPLKPVFISDFWIATFDYQRVRANGVEETWNWISWKKVVWARMWHSGFSTDQNGIYCNHEVPQKLSWCLNISTYIYIYIVVNRRLIIWHSLLTVCLFTRLAFLLSMGFTSSPLFLGKIPESCPKWMHPVQFSFFFEGGVFFPLG